MKYLSILVFLFSNIVLSQDTIQVSKKYKTILIFPENVAESIIGNDLNFLVDLPKPDGSQFNKRILKLFYNEVANEKKDYTNYTVITDSGNSYDYILELVDKPKKLTWYINAKEAIKNISEKNQNYVQENIKKYKKLPKDSLKLVTSKATYYSKGISTISNTNKDSIPSGTPNDELYENDVFEYYRLRSYYMQFDKSQIPRFFARNGDVFLWLKGVYYDKDEIYFQFKIENGESVDYDVNFVKFAIATDYKKSSSNQTVPHTPVYLFKQPKRVKGTTENHFVVVFKKFSLDKNKVLLVEMDEEKGSRNFSMKIHSKLINNPSRL